MHRLALVVLTALVLVPSALAKEENAAIVVGPSGNALVEPLSTLTGLRLASVEPPGGPFALVYPQRHMTPSAPGRWYPRAAVYCDARGRCAHDAHLGGWFGSGRVTGLFHGSPTRLATLRRDAGPLRAASPLAYAIELAFGQAGSSTRAAAPATCVHVQVTWRGTAAAARPTSLCVGSNGGVWAGGRLYPLYSGIAAQLSH